MNFSFKNDLHNVMSSLQEMLLQKNAAYGDSALNPVRVFSKATTGEQLLVRLDDKLSRIAKGSEFPGDDTITDIIGYLVILLIHRRREDALFKAKGLDLLASKSYTTHN